MRNLISYLIFILMLYGCEKYTDNILGVYTTENSSNTIDSLVLGNEGVYKRTLRRRVDNSLIFENKGTWMYDGNRINLSGFLIDKDQNYKAMVYDSYFDDVLITASLPVKKETTRVVIAIDHKLNLYYVSNKKSK